MARPGKLTESSIQAAVWQIELGRGQSVVRWALLVLLALGVGLLYTACQFHGLTKREVMDQAQLARNLARGEGFTTSCIRPLSLWQLKNFRPDHDSRLMHHPDLQNPPVYPLVLAGLFKLLPARAFETNLRDRIYAPERWVILPLAQLCLLLTVLLVYRWARELFDQRVAVTTGLLLLFSVALWEYGVSGLAINFLMLLLSLALYCLFRADRRLNPPEIPAAEQTIGPAPDAAVAALVVLSAVLLGLCFLTRYLTAFLAPALAVYVARIFRGRHPGRWVALYALVLAAVITPWLARNQRVSGSLLGTAKYAMIDNGGIFIGDSLPRSYHPDKDGALATASRPRKLAGNLVRGLREHLCGSFNRIGSNFLVLFFAVGVMYQFRRRDVTRLRGAVLGGVLAGLLGMALVGVTREFVQPAVHGDDLLVLFWPLVALYGVAFFYLLLDRITFRIRLTRAAAVGGFVLLNVAPLILVLLPPRTGPVPYPPYNCTVTQEVAQYFAKDELGCSDLPWAMAWYGDRRTVWLPMTVEEFHEINYYATPKHVSFRFLLLTPYMLDRPLTSSLFNGEYRGWATMVQGKLPKDFPLTVVSALPPDGWQYLLADKPRWVSEPASNASPAPTTVHPDQPVSAAPSKPAASAKE